LALPSVSFTIGDGALGAVAVAGRTQAVIGVASKGPIATPSSFSSVKALTDAFGTGPGVEAAASAIASGASVLFIRCEQAADGTFGTLHDEGTGTSVITLGAGAGAKKPADDYDLAVEFLNDGTVGTAGVRYRVSLDGGANYGPSLALGTANSIDLDGVATLALGAGTIKAGDKTSVRTFAPTVSASTLGAALDAFALSAVQVATVHVTVPITAALGGAIDTKLTAMSAKAKPRRWIGSIRTPNDGESDAAYQTVAQGIRAGYSTKLGMVCAGACVQVSAISSRSFVRPVSFAVAAREAVVEEHIDTADVNLGALTGVSIKDANGNPLTRLHDEGANEGLDAMGYCTLRTHETLSGVYITRPRLFSEEGSDYRLLAHGRVTDLAHRTAYGNLLRRLNRAVEVDAKSGRILESEARDIEAGCNAALRAVLMSAPKASDVQTIVDRTGDILASGEVRVSIRVLPLAYLEHIVVDLSFTNPASAAAA
jgi:hypothetical protein